MQESIVIKADVPKMMIARDLLMKQSIISVNVSYKQLLTAHVNPLAISQIAHYTLALHELNLSSGVP